MKNTFKSLIVLSLLFAASCNKDEFNPHSYGSPAVGYSTTAQLLHSIGPKMQFYMIDAISGGSFITPQGTTVHIPASAFVNSSNQPVTGQVLICFKDLYKKSDMLLSDMCPMYSNGWPLKSGGEFYIKVTQFNQPLQLAPGKKIVAEQPVALTGGQADSAMLPLVVQPDTMNNAAAWNWNPADSVTAYPSYYMFSMYQFSMPADSGTWCNSDNPSYFSSYTQVSISAHSDQDPGLYNTDMFLVFSGVSSMVHVYRGTSAQYNTYYPYSFAPLGLNATFVAVGVKDGKIYASFTPVTISANLDVNFTLSEISTDDFKAQLEALN